LYVYSFISQDMDDVDEAVDVDESLDHSEDGMSSMDLCDSGPADGEDVDEASNC
jgi:hypothetical protein